MAEGDKK